jgi:hypothetical protein
MASTITEKIWIVDIKNQDIYYVRKEEYEVMQKVAKKSKRHINVEEQKANLRKISYYDISNQDVYPVYVDKDGNMYDMNGFEVE